MIAMKFTFDMDIGLSLLTAALPQLVTEGETKSHRRGRSERSYGRLPHVRRLARKRGRATPICAPSAPHAYAVEMARGGIHLVHARPAPTSSMWRPASMTLFAQKGRLRGSATFAHRSDSRFLTATLGRADSDASTMKRCEQKIRYRTAAGAKCALWGIWIDRYLRGRRHRRERRAYSCPICAGWHLTSHAKRRH
jgi:hypothetical protein